MKIIAHLQHMIKPDPVHQASRAYWRAYYADGLWSTLRPVPVPSQCSAGPGQSGHGEAADPVGANP